MLCMFVHNKYVYNDDCCVTHLFSLYVHFPFIVFCKENWEKHSTNSMLCLTRDECFFLMMNITKSQHFVNTNSSITISHHKIVIEICSYNALSVQRNLKCSYNTIIIT